MDSVESFATIRTRLEYTDLVHLPVDRLIELRAIVVSAEQPLNFQCVVFSKNHRQLSFVDSIFTDTQIEGILKEEGFVIPASKWDECKYLIDHITEPELYEMETNLDGQVNLYRGNYSYYNHGRDVEVENYKMFLPCLSGYQLRLFSLMKGRV